MQRLHKLGGALRWLRRRQGSTPRELADALGVPAARIGEWERGAKTPTLKTFVRIAEVLEVDLGDFDDALLAAQFKAARGRRRRELEIAIRRKALDSELQAEDILSTLGSSPIALRAAAADLEEELVRMVEDIDAKPATSSEQAVSLADLRDSLVEYIAHLRKTHGLRPAHPAPKPEGSEKPN